MSGPVIVKHLNIAVKYSGTGEVMKKIIFALFMIILFTGFAGAGEIYECIDGNGNTLFADVRQEGMKCNLQNSGESLTTADDNQVSKNESGDSRENDLLPYNCIKSCVQEGREARKSCVGIPGERHACMTRAKEQMDKCRNKCGDEDKYAAANRRIRKNDVEDYSKRATLDNVNTASSQTVNFILVDKRNPAEREGYPYPKSPIKHVMFGDRSLNVDRLGILKEKLTKRFGSKLKGKTLVMNQFYVFEAVTRDAYVKTPSGQLVQNTGPFLPTLRSEINIQIDGFYFTGSKTLSLAKGSGTTKASLELTTNMIVDELLRDMDKNWDTAQIMYSASQKSR